MQTLIFGLIYLFTHFGLLDISCGLDEYVMRIDIDNDEKSGNRGEAIYFTLCNDVNNLTLCSNVYKTTTRLKNGHTYTFKIDISDLAEFSDYDDLKAIYFFINLTDEKICFAILTAAKATETAAAPISVSVRIFFATEKVF